MQVVIDTNIIVSALLNPKGACYIFLDRVFAGVYDVVASSDIIKEYDDVLFYITAKATKSRLVTGNIKHYPIEQMRTMIWELT